MGALHAGHAALIDAARRDGGVVVVSIFVNPLQFNNKDDLARYPRTLDADVAFCRERGVDIVFAPSAAEVYPQPLECSVDVGRLADHLCGPFRPGHFQGVATVVLKLFDMVQPHRAYFGEKDAQQLAIVQRLVADFNLPIAVIGVPTVREADGLAMSSRNRHLSADERRVAVSLYQSLIEARQRNFERREAARRYHPRGCGSDSPIRRPEARVSGDCRPEHHAAGRRNQRSCSCRGRAMGRFHEAYRQPAGVMSIRTAGPHDAAALASLINAAFVVEAFFKIGDRTSADEVAALMDAGGEFLVLEGLPRRSGEAAKAGTGTGTGTLTGCVYLKCSGERALFRDAVHRSWQTAARRRATARRRGRVPRPRARVPVHGPAHRQPARRARFPTIGGLDMPRAEPCRFRSPNVPVSLVSS